MQNTKVDPEAVRKMVRTGYSQIAQGGSERRGGGKGCCGASPAETEKLAEHIGYSREELSGLPDGANMGLSCGNPNALAALKPGEMVLDLGSGGGFDMFIAGGKIGSTGRAIGVDMTPDMLSKARKNIEAYRQKSGLNNVEFRLGEIEHLPVADASVDAVISNCVINLSPDKPQVWREIARVLKPQGVFFSKSFTLPSIRTFLPDTFCSILKRTVLAGTNSVRPSPPPTCYSRIVSNGNDWTSSVQPTKLDEVHHSFSMGKVRLAPNQPVTDTSGIKEKIRMR